jgi:hypothetical protein
MPRTGSSALVTSIRKLSREKHDISEPLGFKVIEDNGRLLQCNEINTQREHTIGLLKNHKPTFKVLVHHFDDDLIDLLNERQLICLKRKDFFDHALSYVVAKEHNFWAHHEKGIYRKFFADTQTLNNFAQSIKKFNTIEKSLKFTSTLFYEDIAHTLPNKKMITYKQKVSLLKNRNEVFDLLNKLQQNEAIRHYYNF